MGKYRTKIVEIEAHQFQDHSNLTPTVPMWFVDAINDGKIKASTDHLMIDTLEGVMRADVGDYIIKGLKGELYPCKPDIFVMKYEEIV